MRPASVWLAFLAISSLWPLPAAAEVIEPHRIVLSFGVLWFLVGLVLLARLCGDASGVVCATDDGSAPLVVDGACVVTAKDESSAGRPRPGDCRALAF